MCRGTFSVCCLVACLWALGGQGSGQTTVQSTGVTPVQNQIRKGTGFILGRAVDVRTGQPVAGALVALTGYGNVPGGVPGGQVANAPVTAAQLSASPSRSAITNSDGYFFFRELGGGRFALSVTAMGYLAGGYLQNKPNGTIHFLDLGDDEQYRDVVLRLWKYASVSGTVLDESGEAAVGATVRVLQRSISGGSVRLQPTGNVAETDDRGVYRAGGLVPGDYVVGIITTQSTIPVALGEAYAEAVAQAPDPNRPPPMRGDLQNGGVSSPSGAGIRIGDVILQLSGTSRVGYTPPQPADDGRMLSYSTTFFQNAGAALEATVITLGSGEERTGLDLSLRLVSAVRISGTLTGPEGPMKDIGVSLIQRGTEPLLNDSFFAAATAATDATGAFTLLGVPPGSYTLKASRSLIVRNAPASATSDRLLWVAQAMTVGNTDITGVTVAMRPGLTVSGRVEFVGAAPPPSAEQIQRITVSTISATTGQSERAASVLARADGTFTTNGNLPGRYFVFASAPQNWTLQSVKQAGRNVTDESIELTSADATDLVATFIDKSSKLSGTVTDTRGAPAEQAEVIVFPSDSDGWTRGEISRRVRMRPATKGGAFEFATLPAGAYHVVAVDNTTTAQWSDPVFLKQLISGATRVSIADGDSPTVALKLFTVR